MVDLAALAKPFPREKVHWRAQTLTKDGNKAMALAYVDARDVMERLDEVCGPQGWQSEHFDCGGGKLGCRIGINILLDIGMQAVAADNTVVEQWVWKSDGAGETDIEGAKGAFSGAFKRAAVSWGIGRYLYDMDAVWVPCETTEWQGKKRFKRFTADPWNFVKPDRSGPPTPRDDLPKKPSQAGHPDRIPHDMDSDEIIEGTVLGMINAINQTETLEALTAWKKRDGGMATRSNLGNDGYERVHVAYQYKKEQLSKEAEIDPPWEDEEAKRQDADLERIVREGFGG